MRRVVVTGATGFIGRHSIARLLERGYEVHAITIEDRIDGGPLTGPNCYCHKASLTDKDAVGAIMDAVRPSHLLHFAWYVDEGKFWQSRENFRWVEASLALLRAFEEGGGKRVVMAGTCAEYDWTAGRLSEDHTSRAPRHPYGVCKNALHDMAASYSGKFGMSFAWGRVFFVYGPGEPSSKLVSSVARAIMRGERAYCGQPHLIRDYLYVEDVAAAFVALLDSAVQGAVNIASGQPVSLREIVETIAGLLRGRHLVEFAVSSREDAPVVVGDNHRLSREVGWQPEFTLETGLASTINWLGTNLAGT